ncbi:putative clathrin assembly protein At5g57200 [Rutidosis leptorrhynchoides]|uniref:putative clathrin assembly protein At5g57200 n=1 Tax=Rutidosis leptorrhynchoides TaxID=125765 RepID=UPI003A98E989
MATFESWRRAFGAIKDSTTVSLAKVSSDFKNIDIAIVKATNHEECPPKDLHVRRIIVATSFSAPRADVGYCIHTLSKRLTKTKNWIVAGKTLMVLHRILREGDPSFREELLIYARRKKIFQIPEFRDESSLLACDCSSWIRNYATYLEERMECFRALGFDIETERLTIAPGMGKAYSRTRLMNIDELLDQLPVMQQLLHCLIACQPEGAAYQNCLIQHAFTFVLKESFKIYAVISDGIVKLIELFFNLSKDDAVNALNIYKKSGKQAEQLTDFYNLGKHMRPAMNIQFPTLNQPPPSFLATMEEYVQAVSSNSSMLEHQDVVEVQSSIEIKKVENKEVIQEDQETESTTQQIVEVEKEEVLPLIVIDDKDCQVRKKPLTNYIAFFEVNETSKKAAELADINASQSPLPIVQYGKMNLERNNSVKLSGWEVAVVTPSSNTNNDTNLISQTKPVGGFDILQLYSLYEDDIMKKQIQNEYCKQQDHLMVRMQQQPLQQQYVTMNQQPYQQLYQQQQNMLIAYNHQQSSSTQYLQRQMSNLKANALGAGISYHPQGNQGLI